MSTWRKDVEFGNLWQTYEHVSGTQQKVGREEGHSIEGKRLQVAGTTGKVKDPDQHTAQAEIHRPAVHDDPVMALCKDIIQNLLRTNVSQVAEIALWGRELKESRGAVQTHMHRGGCVRLHALEEDT